MGQEEWKHINGNDEEIIGMICDWLTNLVRRKSSRNVNIFTATRDKTPIYSHRYQVGMQSIQPLSKVKKFATLTPIQYLILDQVTHTSSFLFPTTDIWVFT